MHDACVARQGMAITDITVERSKGWLFKWTCSYKLDGVYHSGFGFTAKGAIRDAFSERPIKRAQELYKQQTAVVRI